MIFSSVLTKGACNFKQWMFRVYNYMSEFYPQTFVNSRYLRETERKRESLSVCLMFWHCFEVCECRLIQREVAVLFCKARVCLSIRAQLVALFFCPEQNNHHSQVNTTHGKWNTVQMRTLVLFTVLSSPFLGVSLLQFKEQRESIEGSLNQVHQHF